MTDADKIQIEKVAIAEHQCRSILHNPGPAANLADLNRSPNSCWTIDDLTVIRGGTI